MVFRAAAAARRGDETSSLEETEQWVVEVCFQTAAGGTDPARAGGWHVQIRAGPAMAGRREDQTRATASGFFFICGKS